ncbi:MAG: twin transmembrane helix small protein [Pseudomonadota bacterium]
MSGTIFLAGILFCFVTLAVLMIGVLGFGTGKTSGSTSNKLMRFRIFFQFVAVCLLLVGVWIAKGGN